MSEGVEVDPVALGRAAELTNEVAVEVRGVLTDLRGKLAGYEEAGTNQPWGNDKMGKKFTTGKKDDGYHASRDNLLAGLEGTAGTLDEFATGQRDAVKVLTQADQGGV
ncbi:hypothetical protein [Nocardia harenae]|uniref:hypothetical protein n=1 Tax=Nocardia harenae TaxID=358707 RepID=UPI00082C7EA0|nr:hypothetical protein [Nocardia harenae]